jgi:hypothetical protein
LVTYSATDISGNTSSATATITVVDHEAPSLTIPPSFTVNATSPAGAFVSFTATGSDNSGFATVSCSPTSGSQYGIGVSTTSCTATDGSGNSTQGSFSVRVLGASDQIANLAEFIGGTTIPEPYRTQLVNGLRTLLGDARSPSVSCPALSLFIGTVRARAPYIPALAAKAPQIIADATRIKAVIGCP